MRRRDFIKTIAGSIALAPIAARSQRVWRIGVLDGVSATLNSKNYDALQQGLRELGYVEGQNLSIEYRSADGHTARFPELATELVRLGVDLIVTRGTPATLAAKQASITLPVVMAASGDPVGTGLVTSLRQPGGNVTGLSAIVGDLYPKRVEILKEIVPASVEVGAIMNLKNPVMVPESKEIEKAVRSVGLRFRLFDVSNVDEIRSAFDQAGREARLALVIGNDGLTYEHRKIITELAAKHRLPAIYSSREFVDDGGLASYGVNYPNLYRRAATYVDKIFKGAKPADLPIEQPSKLELVINLKAAKALGHEIPRTLLAGADDVIE